MKSYKSASVFRFVPIIILFSLAIIQSCRKEPREMTNEEIAEQLMDEATYNELLKYAETVGVNTTRFADQEDKEPPVFGLLEEIAYGHKPDIRYVEHTQGSDTILIREAAEELVKGQNVPHQMGVIEPEFAPYKNLKVHFARLMAEGKKDSANLVADALNTYRWIRRQSAGSPRFVIVNICGAYLKGMDALGNEEISMRTVVGKQDTPTPTIDTYATSIVTHPYWNVPKSIAIREILPKVRVDRAYLVRNKIEIIGASGQAVDPEEIDWEAMPVDKFPYRFRQQTGEDNSLGLLKVEIKNPLAIYLHDTNARYLFTKNDRWRSHGCVRVQRPTDLANFMAGEELLKNDFLTEPDTTKITPQWYKLKKHVPVFLIYLRVDCDAGGNLVYYKDIYKRGAPTV